MVSLQVLAFDHEGRPLQFDTWLDDLQLYLLSDIKDSVSLFDHMSGAATAPPATADSANRSQWHSRDAAARLAIRNHLPLAECAHFGQHRTAQALYNAVVARYSSPATAALGLLLLPHLFPELSAFATVEDLVSHLRASDARYRAAAPTEFLDRNQPPMFITLYFIVTRLPDSLCSVSDHFLSLDPTSLTINLLKQHLLAAETSAVAVGAARGTPCPPFFEGTSGLLLLVRSAATARARVAGVVEVAAVVEEVAVGVVVGGSSGGGGGGGTGGGSGGSGGGGGGSSASGGSGGGGTGGGGTGARRVGSGGGQRQQQQCRSETQSPQQLREWFLQRGASGGSDSCPYVIRTGDRAGQTCGRLHTQHRCCSRLDDAWQAEFGDDAKLPRWADLLRSRIVIFDLDFDAILSTMYALSVSVEGDCYWYVQPHPGIAAAALGAGESGTLTSTAPAQALHSFTLDSSTSRCFFRGSTTLTPLPAPVPVRLADPSGGSFVARSSTVLPCPAVPSGSLSGLHLPSFSTNLVSASGHVAASCSCRLLPHQTLLWHHRLGHPSLPRLRGMHSRLLVSGLPRSLPPLPPLPAPPCLPCVEGRQRAAPHSSSFPPTTAPLQTLHMDMWGPARISGQGRERYFLLVVDEYTRYTTVFPLRSKGEFSAVLIPWIGTIRLQLRERFGQDLPVLRLHSDSGGEFSFDLLRDFCHGEGILQSFTLPDSPQQNGIDERRTSMIHAAAPHFLWPFAVRYAAHQLNLWPRISLPETSPTLRWTGEVGDASLFRDVTFDESVPFYRLFPYRSAPPPPLPLFLAPGPPPIGPLPPQCPAPSGVSQVAESEDAGSRGAGPGGEEPAGAEPAGVETGGVEPGGAESEGADSGGAEPRATGAGEVGDAGAGCAGVTAGAGGAGVAATGSRGARIRGSGAAGAGGAGAVDPRAGGAGDTVRLRPYFVPLLQQVHGVPPSTSLTPPLLCPPPDQPQLPLQSVSLLPAPSPYTEQTGGLTEQREPASCPVSTVRTARRVPHSRPPPVPGTHAMALRPSSIPLRVPLPAPPESSLPEVPDPESNRTRAANPTVARLLATTVTGPSFESAAASALVAELLDFAASCRLDYATALVAESESGGPSSFGGECALGTDVLEDRQEDFECLAAAVPRSASMLLAPEGDPNASDILTPRSYAEAITGSYSSQWQAVMDAEMASWKSTCTYVDEVPPPGANIVDGMWIFRVKRPPGSPPAFKARYVPRGFCQRQRVDYFQTFSPTPKMTTLRVLLHVAAQRDYELHSLNFSTTFLQGSLHEEIWLRLPPGFTELFLAGTQWSLRRPVYGLRQAPREWHDTLRTTLAALGFAHSTAHPSLFLRTDTSRSPFYVLVYVNDLVFATTDTEALTLVKSELQKRHTCTDLGPSALRLPVAIAIAAAACAPTFCRRLSTATHLCRCPAVLRRPPGFTGSFPPGTQWSLRRPVYGLRQAPREWHDTLRTTLAELGFAPSTADPSLFLRTDTSLPPFYILVYVDDLVFATADTAGLAYVKSELQKRHTCTDLGELRSYLGLQITQDRARRTITLTQSHMVQQVLQRFGFTYSSPQATPLPTRHSLSALPSDESVESSGPILARYVAPGRHRPEHMAAAKRVLRYLCSTSGMGLVLGGRSPVVLTGHADASWADDQATQRSSQGYTFGLGSGSVSWRSTRSSSVLGSSCEAEIYAGAMAAQELRWLTYLLTDLGEPPRSPPVLYVDNKAMLALCREQRLEHRTKHIALRYFLAREL
ncbi:unnamed protein product [Closterium sp. NIES-53]